MPLLDERCSANPQQNKGTEHGQTLSRTALLALTVPEFPQAGAYSQLHIDISLQRRRDFALSDRHMIESNDQLLDIIGHQ